LTLPHSHNLADPAIWLKLDEAVELCTAWLQGQARARGIRLLVLKGDALSRQGLRAPRSSADVDLLIEPARVQEFLVVLESMGWRKFASTFASEQFTTHSRTLMREGWPNSIDVHSSWPGFLSSPVEVFETLWARRMEMTFAHRSCDAPDRMANVLMLALHSLRGNTAQPRHRAELEGILQLALTSDEIADLADLSVKMGAVGPLRSILPQLGVPVKVNTKSLRSAAYLDWHRKIVQSHTRGRAASWLIELRRAAWRQKPLILRHGFWPTGRDLLAEHPDIPDRFVSILWARVARLSRAVSQLPRVLPALRRR
jgi:hypothetical protein